MRIYLTVAVMVLSLYVSTPALPEGGTFSGVPRSHWAYRASDRLVQAGLASYPPVCFSTARGVAYDTSHRTLTRYEFAIITQTALRSLNTRSKRVEGRAAEQRSNLRRLVERLAREFKPELAQLNRDAGSNLLPCTVGQTAAPLPPVAPQARQNYVAVLVWHDVLPQKEVWFDTTLATFKAQLAEIKRRGFHVVTLDALTGYLVEGAPLPPRSLALTFDDNTRGLYDNVFPLLKQYGYPAALFVHTDYVGVRTVKPHCDWKQLAEMQANGLITVQSLTCSHPPDLRPLSEKQLDHELRDSKAALERRLGKPVYVFVYTEGKYDARVAQAVARNGYRVAFTEDWGNAGASPNLMMIHRYSILKRFRQALDDVDRANRESSRR
jgi:peptidoglycan/xylan/chitin deacetylase (PgdA/CDA1 family)